MRPSRVFLLLCGVLLSILLISSIVRSSSRIHPSAATFNGYTKNKRNGIRALFSFATPLFPSSAIISLTDDNSTFFLSRPAAFGPLLPDSGLSGQLWIGNGFGEDTKSSTGTKLLLEGELGCSDAPDWDEDLTRTSIHKATTDKADTQSHHDKSKAGSRKRHVAKSRDTISTEDGTDDHLHQSVLTAPKEASALKDAATRFSKERAEIAGKIVLLSRGGCGFVDKARWAERRGAVAVVVGDNIPGGPLVTMYAKGDADNVTISALFTSHTTAHLLSSLIPSTDGSFIGVPSKNGKMPARSGNSWDDRKTERLRSHLQGTNHPSSLLGKLKMFFGTPRSLPSNLIRKSVRPTADLHSMPAPSPRDGPLQKALSASNDDDAKFFTQPFNEARPRQALRGQIKKLVKAKRGAIPNYGPSIHNPNRNDQVEDDDTHKSKLDMASQHKPVVSYYHTTIQDYEDAPPIRHEGLWITLTPTSMSSSPFFDTILVLVISPLVTLTIVYAMLLIRSRIRRRRWRAPKSLVERLPVRTYHTINSSGASTNAVATPAADNARTPLLQHSTGSLQPPAQMDNSATGEEPSVPATVPPAASSSNTSPQDSNTSLASSEKRESGLAAWRRRYGGRQRECVVCPEEYVDGVSRVMSLPCGHEFHVECITPWLTTRRRTCPICKGDVVRSMARAGLTSMPAGERSGTSFESEDNDDLDSDDLVDIDVDAVQARAAGRRNDDPESQRPVPNEEDPEAARWVEVGGFGEWINRVVDRSIDNLNGWFGNGREGRRGRDRRQRN